MGWTTRDLGWDGKAPHDPNLTGGYPDGQHPGRQYPSDLGEPGAVTVGAVSVDGVRPYLLRDDGDGVVLRAMTAQPTENPQLTLPPASPRTWDRNALVHPAVSARTRIGVP